MSQENFSEVEPLIKKFSAKTLRTLHNAGHRTVSFDDIYQECVVAWCIARDKWDAKFGVPFVPYFINGMKNHVYAWVNKEVKKNFFSNVSLDESISSEDDSAARHNFIASNVESQEESLIKRNSFSQILESLSETARKFVTLLESPPIELYAESNRIKMRVEYGRSQGINSFAFSGITSGLIFDLMGLSNADRNKINSEIRQVTRDFMNDNKARN
jgi:DNA-directed RNA polymerase specialized sigma24 family protein